MGNVNDVHLVLKGQLVIMAIMLAVGYVFVELCCFNLLNPSLKCVLGLKSI